MNNTEATQTSRFPFALRTSIERVETGVELAPHFDACGLVACVTTDVDSGDVLMIGHMNAEALTLTLATGDAHYWSRSRQQLWRKGASSGMVQRVHEVRVDDDQDAIWLRVRVEGIGASCHVGYRSCFYRRAPVGYQAEEPVPLSYVESERLFDPAVIYGDASSPTRL